MSKYTADEVSAEIKRAEESMDRVHDFILCAEVNDLPLCRTEDIPDPQRVADENEIKEEQYVSDRGDALRESKYGKGL